MATNDFSRHLHRMVPLVIAAVLTLPLASCESEVDAIVGSDIPFTLWGFFNTGADTQYVRVFAVSDHLVPLPGEAIDATVRSIDLTTGEQRTWAYEQVVFDSLISGHVFSSPFRAQHEHRYRLSVERSDGVSSSVEVTVPPRVDLDVTVAPTSPLVPIEVHGQIPNLVGFRVTYDGINIPPLKAWPVGTPVAPAVELPVTVVYDNQAQRMPYGWKIEIDMERDYAAVQKVYSLNCLVTLPGGSAPDIWLRNMRVVALAADSSWAPPGGSFDPDVLSTPGTFSNVENGYGYFGAGQAIELEWTPPTEVSLAAGYRFEPKCTGLAPTNTPDCREPPVPCVDETVRDLWKVWLR